MLLSKNIPITKVIDRNSTLVRLPGDRLVGDREHLPTLHPDVLTTAPSCL
ncbi:MAG: hypothetical protein RMY34_34095 [Aulosira sp. DedQUE10]|nr:hypothetical protein [Aulosira sp. DedQUE10]